MFDGQRYATRGVVERVPPDVQLLLWSLIKRLKRERQLDYLQVFELTEEQTDRWNLKVIHRQELPQYSRTWRVFATNAVNERVFVIDNGTYATMMLASEY